MKKKKKIVIIEIEIKNIVLVDYLCLKQFQASIQIIAYTFNFLIQCMK